MLTQRRKNKGDLSLVVIRRQWRSTSEITTSSHTERLSVPRWKIVTHIDTIWTKGSLHCSALHCAKLMLVISCLTTREYFDPLSKGLWFQKMNECATLIEHLIVFTKLICHQSLNYRWIEERNGCEKWKWGSIIEV